MQHSRPQRIQILGNSGGGKSTLARQLGEALDLPVIHLDRIFWNPGWVETPRDEFDAKVLELATTDRWVIDGNYSRTLPTRIERADLIIWIDVSRPMRSGASPNAPSRNTVEPDPTWVTTAPSTSTSASSPSSGTLRSAAELTTGR